MNLDSETALRSLRKTASSPASSASFSLSDFLSASFAALCSSLCFCCCPLEEDDDDGSEPLISLESRFSRWLVAEDRLGGDGPPALRVGGRHLR